MADHQENVLTDHAYDGIQEYDNPMPGWWVWGFILTVIFAFPYWAWFHMSDGHGIIAEFEADMARAEALAPRLDESKAAMLGYLLRHEPQPLYVLEAGQCVSVETIGGPVVWMERSALRTLERREGCRALEVLTLGLPREVDGGMVEVDYRFSQGPEVLCSGVVAMVPDEGGRWRVQEWFARESWCR